MNKKLVTRCKFHGWLAVSEALVLRRNPVNLQDRLATENKFCKSILQIDSVVNRNFTTFNSATKTFSKRCGAIDKTIEI